MAKDIVEVPKPNLGGRPSKYDPSFADQARKLCLLGATDAEIASFFDVCETTINNWKLEHPGFLESIRAGKIIADAEVADSLYRRSTGEHVTLEKVVKKGDGSYEAIRYKSFVPGEVAAQRLWLLNRRKADWRDKQDVELAGHLTYSKVQREVIDPQHPNS